MFFVPERSASPHHGFTIMNRLSTENLVEPINKDLEFQLQDPFLLYRNGNCECFVVQLHRNCRCHVQEIHISVYAWTEIRCAAELHSFSKFEGTKKDHHPRISANVSQLHNISLVQCFSHNIVLYHKR